MLVTAGYDIEFVRWGCTLRDVQTFVLQVTKDRIEENQQISMAMMVALSGLFDDKGVKQIRKTVETTLAQIDKAQGELYEIGVAQENSSAVSKQKANAPAEDLGGLTPKQVETWRKAAKIDAAMAKLTGRMTGAPWSQVNMGNLRAFDMDSFSKNADGISAQEIIAIAKQAHERIAESRMRPGPRTLPKGNRKKKK